MSELVSGAPGDMPGVIAGGSSLWARVCEAAQTPPREVSLRDARLLDPIPRPQRNLFCVGWNYLEHFEEGRGQRGTNPDPSQIPVYSALFSKQPSTVVGPEAPVLYPAPHSEQLDWEVELAIVIARSGREVQRRHGGQWFKGKNFDTHCPLGP